MEQTPKEKLLEKIISKLKENVTHSEEFLKSEALDPVNKKIDILIQNVHGLIEKNGIEQDMKGSLSLVLNGLENIRDNYTYFKNIYNTYVFILDAMYNEYSNSASEPAKIVKEVHSERDMPSQAPIPQYQPQQKSKEPAVVVKKVIDEEPKEKSGRFKFQI